MRFRAVRRPEPEINLTPLIDILFIVLMFLLLTTTFKEITFMRVSLPEARTGGRLAESDPRRFRVVIEASGAVFVGDRQIAIDELPGLLEAIPDKREAEVLLTADERVAHGQVVRIMDLVRRAGIFNLSIETIADGGVRPPRP